MTTIHKKKLIQRTIQFFTCSMLKSVLPISCLMLIACGGKGDQGNIDLTPNDTLGEVQMNQERVSAVDFNNNITLMQEDLLTAIDYLFISDFMDVQANLDNTLFEVEMKQAELHEMSFDGSEAAFVAQMDSLLSFYKSELSGGFREIMPVLLHEELTDEDLDVLDAYDLVFAAKEKKAFERVFEAQDAFAETNNISLEKR